MSDNTPAPRRKSISMHDNAPEWDDCCTCAAEPYWVEIGEQIERERQQATADRDESD